MLEQYGFCIFMSDEGVFLNIHTSAQMFPFNNNESENNFFDKLSLMQWVMEADFRQQIFIANQNFSNNLICKFYSHHQNVFDAFCFKRMLESTMKCESCNLFNLI